MDAEVAPLVCFPAHCDNSHFEVLYISYTRDSVSSGYQNKKRVENTTQSSVFLTKYEVFG